nr:EOG090X0FII [Eulimnadia texana]
MADEDGFITVPKRKGFKSKNLPAKTDSIQAVQSPIFDSQGFLRKIKRCQDELVSSDFLRDFWDSFGQPIDRQILTIICYALGNFSECKISQYQLGLLIILQETLKAQVEIFDPVFSEKEKDILQNLNFKVIEVNTEGKHKVEQLTLFYLPHSPKELVNNILFANWQKELLANCVFVSNSFDNIFLKTPAKILDKNFSFISRISSLYKEKEIKNSFRFKDIFNDTSVHTFPSVNLNSCTADFWESREEPTYSESEEFKRG